MVDIKRYLRIGNGRMRFCEIEGLMISDFFWSLGKSLNRLIGMEKSNQSKG